MGHELKGVCYSGTTELCDEWKVYEFDAEQGISDEVCGQYVGKDGTVEKEFHCISIH